MKKKMISIISLVLTAGIIWITTGVAFAQNPLPINVTLTLNQSVYLLGDAIGIDMLVENPGGDVITSDGFKAKDFKLYLLFTDPDGKNIISDQLQAESPSGEPPMPFSIIVGLSRLQVDPVEIVESGWSISVPITDHRDHYPAFTKAGSYTVRAYIPGLSYPLVNHVIEGQEYANIGSANASGTHPSNVVNFTIVADLDGDQYSYPVADARISPYSEADCNDNDASINPGAVELVGNGVDDDCNPATIDAVSPGTLIVKAERHTKGQHSTKEPIVALPVRVYDNRQGSCAKQIGVSPQRYKSVWLSCYPVENGIGGTDSAGMASLDIAPGNYEVIGEYNPGAEDEEYLGRSVGAIESDETVQKYLQVIVK
jgi:hypothetical protein